MLADARACARRSARRTCQDGTSADTMQRGCGDCAAPRRIRSTHRTDGTRRPRAGDAPSRAGTGDRPRAAARCAGGVRRRSHHLLEQRPDAGARLRTRFHEPGMRHLGFGLPTCWRCNSRTRAARCCSITGDGSFGFTLQELDTARRERLPVVTSSTTMRPGASSAPASASSSISSLAPPWPTPTTPPSRAASAAGETVDTRRGRGPRPAARLCRGPAGRAGLPHAFCAAPGRPRLRQHEPLRLRRRHVPALSWPDTANSSSCMLQSLSLQTVERDHQDHRMAANARVDRLPSRSTATVASRYFGARVARLTTTLMAFANYR